MELQEALKITGFVICEFKSDGDDECSCCCEKIPNGKDIYYERTCYEVDEGEYYCETCTVGTPARWKEEGEAWAEMHNSKLQDNAL